MIGNLLLPNVREMYEEDFILFSVVEYHKIIEIKFIIPEYISNTQPIDLCQVIFNLLTQEHEELLSVKSVFILFRK